MKKLKKVSKQIGSEGFVQKLVSRNIKLPL